MFVGILIFATLSAITSSALLRLTKLVIHTEHIRTLQNCPADEYYDEHDLDYDPTDVNYQYLSDLFNIQSRIINRYTINRYEILNRYGFLEIFCNALWVSTVHEMFYDYDIIRVLSSINGTTEDIDLRYTEITFSCGIVGAVIAAIPGILGIKAYYAASPNKYIGWHYIMVSAVYVVIYR